jgi:hypothetical protein
VLMMLMLLFLIEFLEKVFVKKLKTDVHVHVMLLYSFKTNGKQKT